MDSTSNATLSVEWVPLGQLFCSPANPRLNDAAVPHVAASIRRFGWRQPIVARRSGEVIAGNTRLKAAKELGAETVPVVWFDGSDLDATAYAIADNRTAEFAEWDQGALARILEDLRAEDALEGVGYSSQDIDSLLAEIAAGTDDLADVVEDVPLEAGDAASSPTVRARHWVAGRGIGVARRHTGTSRLALRIPRCGRVFGARHRVGKWSGKWLWRWWGRDAGIAVCGLLSGLFGRTAIACLATHNRLVAGSSLAGPARDRGYRRRSKSTEYRARGNACRSCVGAAFDRGVGAALVAAWPDAPSGRLGLAALPSVGRDLAQVIHDHLRQTKPE